MHAGGIVRGGDRQQRGEGSMIIYEYATANDMLETMVQHVPQHLLASLTLSSQCSHTHTHTQTHIKQYQKRLQLQPDHRVQ